MACKKSNYIIEDHFSQVEKMIELVKGAKRTILDYKLSRYACYLVVQNADSKKESVALGQTYFAIQTRKQEITEQEYDSLSDDERRFYQKITDIYSMCSVDYDRDSEVTKEFFKTVQNKLHIAICNNF